MRGTGPIKSKWEYLILIMHYKHVIIYMFIFKLFVILGSFTTFYLIQLYILHARSSIYIT
jgi:hypothetical protein